MIGSTLVNQLLNNGILVTAIIRPNSKKIKNLPSHQSLSIVECELDQLMSLSSQLDRDYDVFFHFAWDKTYGDGRNDAHGQEQNIKNTLAAVDLAHTTGCTAFIGAGSQAEFGKVEGTLSDSLPKNPTTGYGIAKYTAGKLSYLLCNQYGLRHCWGRILSAYGPGDNNYTMVMSTVLGMLRGETMAFTKGEQIWDYIFSEDCANAFYCIGEKGKHGKCYTIGSGKPQLLKNYILQIRDSINPALPVELGKMDYYPDQVMKLVADITELTKDTGFVPKITFPEGIQRTIQWCKESKDRS